MHDAVYDTREWASARSAALARDGHRCTVSRLLGGKCVDDLHVHHIVAVAEGGDAFDLDNLATTCAAHHPVWESLRRYVVRSMMGAGVPRCPHSHPTIAGRLQCEARLARARGASAA